MTRLLCWFWWLMGGVGLGGCIERYSPEVAPAAQTNLVVDGFINPQGRTVIKLARTFSINTKNTAPAEAKAQVAVQDDAGRRYALAESPAGTYTSGLLALDPSRQYQLRITTAQGREYASDLLPAVSTPPIDTLTWQLTPQQGAQIYVNTHGANTAARYYRWEYEETHQFTALYQSALEYVASSNSVESRPNERQIFKCWHTEASTVILQSNSALLSQNTIANYPLLLLPPDVRLRYGYSLLVRQVGQTQAEYDYWERLRKNTENLGTVNDPLPGKVTGNVHALADAAEPVLGYVGVHTVAEKRLFIDGAQFPTPRPGSVFNDPIYANCEPPIRAVFTPYYLQQFRDGFLIPIVLTNGPLFGPPSCVDCRLHGTNSKPSFWP